MSRRSTWGSLPLEQVGRKPRVTVLIASSVVRGTHQGESHGGVFLVDFERRQVEQVIDWNTADIDWQGRGWDRGLRGIAFDAERVFIAASNELFVYSPDFRLLASYRNPFLMHCHEIFVYQRRLYLTSTGFDTVLGFDLDNNRFCFGLHIVAVGSGYQGAPFDPTGDGPAPGNLLHLNNVFCDSTGMYLSGLKTAGMVRFDGRTLQRVATLPRGIHNARPFGGGVLFNDTRGRPGAHGWRRAGISASQCRLSMRAGSPTLTLTTHASPAPASAAACVWLATCWWPRAHRPRPSPCMTWSR